MQTAISSDWFRPILDTIPQMIWSTDADGRTDFYNARWYEFTGAPIGSTDGEGWKTLFHPDDQARAWNAWVDSVATGEPYEIEYRLWHHSGAYRWTLGRAMPVRNADGSIARWFGTCTDIDDLKRTEQRAASLASMVGQSRGFIAMADRDGRALFVNDAARAMLSNGRALEVGATLLADLFDEPSRAQFASEASQVLETGTEWVGELALHDGRTGESVPILCSIFVMRGADGEVTGFATTGRDLTDRKREEAALALIAQELSHRIKNIFAVVTSLITLSAKGDPHAQGFAQTVRQRIEALARAHDYVRPDHRANAATNHTARTIHGLLATIISPFQDAVEQRIMVHGDDCPIGLDTATALALILHELATNAVKYGALSSDSGHVAVRCNVTAESFSLRWIETGGPPVTGERDHHDFGTVMAERAIKAQLGAATQRHWNTDGLAMDITIPVKNLLR